MFYISDHLLTHLLSDSNSRDAIASKNRDIGNFEHPYPVAPEFWNAPHIYFFASSVENELILFDDRLLELKKISV